VHVGEQTVGIYQDPEAAGGEAQDEANNEFTAQLQVKSGII